MEQSSRDIAMSLNYRTQMTLNELVDNDSMDFYLVVSKSSYKLSLSLKYILGLKGVAST